MSAWASFVNIWTVSNCEFNVNFLTFLGLYHLFFALKTIRVFEKKAFQFSKKKFLWWLGFS